MDSASLFPIVKPALRAWVVLLCCTAGATSLGAQNTTQTKRSNYLEQAVGAGSLAWQDRVTSPLIYKATPAWYASVGWRQHHDTLATFQVRLTGGFGIARNKFQSPGARVADHYFGRLSVAYARPVVRFWKNTSVLKLGLETALGAVYHNNSSLLNSSESYLIQLEVLGLQVSAMREFGVVSKAGQRKIQCEVQLGLPILGVTSSQNFNGLSPIAVGRDTEYSVLDELRTNAQWRNWSSWFSLNSTAEVRYVLLSGNTLLLRHRLQGARVSQPLAEVGGWWHWGEIGYTLKL